MRTITIIVLVVFSITVSKAQFMDTIQLNQDLSATLEFEHDIKEIIYGNNPVIYDESGNKLVKYYDEYRVGNKVVIVAVKKSAPLTTISVILENDDLFYGFIKHTEKPKKVHYPFKSSSSSKSKKEEHPESKINERMDWIMNASQKYYDIGTEVGGVEFLVTNMMNDKKHTYVKIVIKNNTSGNYTLKGINFVHKERKSNVKGLPDEERKVKKEGMNKRLNSELERTPKESMIKAYSYAEFGYVFPLFTTASGKLSINIFEVEGTREATIKIRTQEIAKIDVF